MTSDKKHRAAGIVRRLREAGFEAFWVGGCVRDMLLGKEPKDFDVATAARPADIAGLFEKTVAVGASFGVMLVVDKPHEFEVATFRRDGTYIDHRHPEEVDFGSMEEDVRRRDFTVNALFFDPIEDKVIDLVDGRADLKAKVLRSVGNPEDRFWEDALRLLRAIRFAACLDFQIDKPTWEAVLEHRRLIRYVSDERIRDELNKMLLHPNRRRAMLLLDESGMLELILPEVAAMKGVEQPPKFHPEGDVWVHTLLALDALENPSLDLVWATLLHDVGKPVTFERADDRIRFNNHQTIGADMTKDILRRLKFPRNAVTDITQMVTRHMDFINVQKMRTSTLRRFLSAWTIEDELNLHLADCLASHGKTDNYTFCRDKLEEFASESVPILPDPLLNGDDLIRMGYLPGPLFGQILNDVVTGQLEGELEDKNEAEGYVIEKYPLNVPD